MRRAVDGHGSEALAAVAVQVLDADRGLGRGAAADAAERHRPARAATDVADARAAAAPGARQRPRAVRHGRRLGLGRSLAGPRGPRPGARVRRPVDVVLHRDRGAREGERQPHVGAAHQVARDPAVAHVDGAVAEGQDVVGLRRVRVGARVCEHLPGRPRPRQRRRRAVHVVVGVPARELGAEHVVGPLPLQDRGRLDRVFPEIRRLGHREVVGAELVDAESVGSLHRKHR